MRKNFTKGNAKAIKEIDWEKYEKIFPERYLIPSRFDCIILQKISQLFKQLGRKINVLEIGSNKNIRYFNKKLIKNYYAFDRYAKVKDKRVIALDEKEITKKKLDLIILRNSFNYLNRKEIGELSILVRKNKCRLIFNTFRFPTIMERPYKSRVAEGTETSRYNAKTKQIVHMLMPKGEGYLIRHSFFYYPLNCLKSLFKGLKMTASERKNSLYVEVC